MGGSFVNKRGIRNASFPPTPVRRSAGRRAAGRSIRSSRTALKHHTSAGRPRIGLVLAGGGAKGGAHVGVLKVLEELHVPIDCIAGTSMGALIGGGYAAGIPADELEKFLIAIDWKRVVGSQGRRDLEPIEQKRSGPTYSNEFEFGVTPNGLATPAGLINTSNVEDLLRVYVARARLETDFDKLPIPYRAVATDMVSSKMIVLDKGDLATAMRASMAIPGGFAPVVMDDMILSDGGLVRNIPVDIARNLCADQVIVVNLVEPEADPMKLQSRHAAAVARHGRHDHRERRVAAGVAEAGRRPHRRHHGRHHHRRFRARAGDRAARRRRGPQDVRRTLEILRARGPVCRLAHGRDSIAEDGGPARRRALRRTQARQSRLPCPKAEGARRRPASTS